MGLRSFLATIPDPATIAWLHNACTATKLHDLPAGLRWVEAKNWHLTLRFLGNLEHRQISALSHILRQELPGIGASQLILSQVRPFPKMKRAQLLAACGENTLQLTHLVNSCEAAAQRIGLKPQSQPFRPHITLARLKGRFPFLPPKSYPLAPHSMPLTQVHLMASELTPGGAIYHQLELFNLRALDV